MIYRTSKLRSNLESGHVVTNLFVLLDCQANRYRTNKFVTTWPADKLNYGGGAGGIVCGVSLRKEERRGSAVKKDPPTSSALRWAHVEEISLRSLRNGLVRLTVERISILKLAGSLCRVGLGKIRLHRQDLRPEFAGFISSV